jgi:hypothetical protein
MGRSNTTRRGPLPAPEVRTDDGTLTRFAGLVPMIRFADGVLELPSRLRDVVQYDGRGRKYGIHLLLFAFMVGALGGVERMAHLEWLKGDSVVEKFLRLPSWPVRKVFAKALGGLSNGALARLQDLLTLVGTWSLGKPEELVVDFDSTTLVCFGEQEGALFGYCGKGRNRRRHHPLVASVAQSRAVVNAWYRDGSAVEAPETIAFFADTLKRLGAWFSGVPVTIRADAGFWSKTLAAWLLGLGVPFFFAYPLSPGLKLRLMPVAFEPQPDDPDVETASLPGPEVGLDDRIRVVVVRRVVHDRKAPPPGKVIDWSPDYRYQAIVTSETDWDPVDIWRFYNGRGDCERVFKTGKHALALSHLVGHDFKANQVAFLLRLIALDADLLFQQHVEGRAIAHKRPARREGLQSRQFRFYNSPGRLLREHGQWVLRVAKGTWVRQLWQFYGPGLLAYP